MQQVVVQLLNGLSLAGILVLVALGLWFIFGVLGVINLAHGALFMLGAYVGVVVYSATGSVFWGIVLAPLAIGVLGLLIEVSIVRRLYERPFDTLLATFALSLVAREVVTLTTSGQYQGVPPPVTGTVTVLGAGYPIYRLFLLALGALTLVAAWLLLYRTPLGLRARAVIHDREIAGAMGINVRLTDATIFGVGSALAGLAGALMSSLVTVSPNMGEPFLALSFLVVIVGGPKRLWGIALGAALLGGGQSLLGLEVDPVAAQVAVFVLAIVLVAIRPQGLITR